MSKGDFARLAAFAEEKGITLFCDEVYRESEYSLEDRLPAACELSASAVSLGVLSKTYGLPGLRIGWLATRNAKLLKRLAELKDYTTICNSAPSEFLGEIALRHRGKLAERNRQVIARNLEELERFVGRHKGLFAWARPNAGPIAFPKLQRGEAGEFCERAVLEAGVMLLPGKVFGPGYGPFIRLGFGRKSMPEALRALESLL